MPGPAFDGKDAVEPLPDLASLPDDELKGLIDELEKEENEISYRRRILHGKIDILKAELQDRLKRAVEAGQGSSIVEANLEKLTEILARKAAPPA
jgi:anti-sigma-K factor RsiG